MGTKSIDVALKADMKLQQFYIEKSSEYLSKLQSFLYLSIHASSSINKKTFITPLIIISSKIFKMQEACPSGSRHPNK